MTTIQEQTDQWYKNYYSQKGKNRNDVLTNSGVLFQQLAFRKSIVKALGMLSVNRDWKVLDVGTGSGGSLVQFLEFGFSPECLWGIDIIQERIQQGEKQFPNIKFICGDASQMNFESDFFDLVMESTMFMQLTNVSLSKKIAEEMIRVVKPGGYIMLVDWRYSFGNPIYKALSRKRIIEIFNVGVMTRIYCQKHGALIPPLGRLMSKYFYPFYFIMQFLLPFLVGQMTTILRKE
jgi:ubiquinone/menaquinone biosynthesis C-methylase UbiE